MIESLISRNRAALFLTIFLLFLGYSSYSRMVREKLPSVDIPIINITSTLRDISPEDAERTMTRPMERSFSGVKGLKEMTANAGRGYASVTLIFDANYSLTDAKDEVRSKIEEVKEDLPSDASVPVMKEVTTDSLPILSIGFYGGNFNELTKAVKDLKNKLSGLKDVGEVLIFGDRREVIEVEAEPAVLEHFNIVPNQLSSLVAGNNLVVSAGSLKRKMSDRAVESSSGLIKNIEDIKSIPVILDKDAALTFGDLFIIRRVFSDPAAVVEINGSRSLSLDISKRSGVSVSDVIRSVKKIVSDSISDFPEGTKVIYSGDVSEDVEQSISGLQNNIIFGVLVIVLIVSFAMGLRSALLMSMVIPLSFSITILTLSAFNFTLNIVVLFGLILSSGIMIDAALVVVETADQIMISGKSKKLAYSQSASRMFLPILSSTATTTVVFLPLLFWPGVTGKFMFFLPSTLTTCMIASFVVALFLLPSLGTMFGGISYSKIHRAKEAEALISGDISSLKGLYLFYSNILSKVLKRPKTVCLGFFGVSFLFILAYFCYGPGFEFFPEMDAERITIFLKTNDERSLDEKTDFMDRMLKKASDLVGNEVKSFYGLAGEGIGEFSSRIIISLKDWRLRRSSSVIVHELSKIFETTEGYDIHVAAESMGPQRGKQLQIRILSEDLSSLEETRSRILKILRADSDLINVGDSSPPLRSIFTVDIDQINSAISYSNTALVGDVLKLAVGGLKIGDYRPDDSNEEVDILLRYPKSFRNENKIKELSLITPNGLYPFEKIIKTKYQKKRDIIKRADGLRSIDIDADLIEGKVLERKVSDLSDILMKPGLLPDKVYLEFKGEEEDRRESETFLKGSFILAISGIFLILLLQFNSFSSSLIIITAVFFSVAGVFLGLWVFMRPFSIVMSGIGLITLAGIIVNNNILFLDAYKEMTEKYKGEHIENVMRASVLRLRPILMTVSTTVIGLMPMIVGLNINFLKGTAEFGAPSAKWWMQLSSSIAGGLTYGTFVTLLATPCMLIIFGQEKKCSTILDKLKNIFSSKTDLN